MKKVSKLISILLFALTMASCIKENDPENGLGNGNGNGGNSTDPSGGGSATVHEYVDLGLPSGTLWANFDVLADYDALGWYGQGDKFAWGEIVPITNYSWNGYKFYGSDGYMTKYCRFIPEIHNSDGLTVLLPEDDAATVNWGNDWCMPTKEQWRELRDNTIFWSLEYEGSGVYLIGPNGNKLYLHGEFNAYGSRYWTSSLDPDYEDCAYCFDWNYSYYNDEGFGIEESTDYRYKGARVRAVRKNH